MAAHDVSASESDGDRVGGSLASELDVAQGLRPRRPETVLHAPPAGQVVYYAVHDSDLCSDNLEIAQYHQKLLTSVDVQHIFKGTRELYAIIMEVEFGRGSYLLLLAGERDRNAKKHQVAQIMAAPSLAAVLAKMHVGFALNARLPDGAVEYLPLLWKLSEDGEQLQLRVEQAQTIALAAAHSDDLLVCDVHFTRGGELLPDFVVLRAILTVGEAACTTKIDAVAVETAIARKLAPTTHKMQVGVSLESYARVEPDDETPHRAIPAMASNGDIPRQRALTPYECWQNVTKTYKNADGWQHMIPGQQYARNCPYAEAELEAVATAYAEGSIIKSRAEARARAENTVAERQVRQCNAALANIVRTRRSAQASGDDVAYMTSDESHVRAVDAMSNPIDPQDAERFQLFNYYVLHRFRAIFSEDAYRDVVFPANVSATLANEPYASKLKEDLAESEQYVEQEATKGVLKQEATTGIPRVVLVRGWTMRCPANFIGATLTKMVDSDVYRGIYAQSQQQRALVPARDVTKDRALWGPILNRALGIFTACSSSRNAYEALNQ